MLFIENFFRVNVLNSNKKTLFQSKKCIHNVIAKYIFGILF